MGTGSTRRRNSSRSRYESYRGGDTLPAGDWSAYNADAAANPTAQNYNSDVYASPYAQWHANQVGMSGDEQHRDWEMRQFGRSPTNPSNTIEQDINATNGTDGAEYNLQDTGLGQVGLEGGHGRHAFGADRVHQLRAFYDALKAKAKADKPSPQSALDAFFEKNYYDPSNDIRGAYGAQESAINAQYDAALKRSEAQGAAATAGVQAEGAGLQTALAALAADGGEAMKKVNAGIDADYAKALRGVNSDYKGFARDLKSSGVGTGDLAKQAASDKTDIRQAQVADSTLGKRYTQMLGEAINNRKATGATVTVAGANDIARVLQESRDNNSADRLKAVSQIEASMAGDLAQAKGAKANAKYQLFLSTLKSGSTLTGAAVKAASPAEQAAARKDVAAGVPNWSTPFKSVLNSKVEGEAAAAAKVMGDIATNKIDPMTAYTQWLASPMRADFPGIDGALLSAINYGVQFTPEFNKAVAAKLHSAGRVLK